MVYKNMIEFLSDDINTIILNQTKSVLEKYLNDTTSISQNNKTKILKNIDKEMKDLQSKVHDRMKIAAQEVDRRESNDVIFLTSKNIKYSIIARAYVSKTVKLDPDVNQTKVAVPAAVEIPTKNKDKGTTWKVNLAPKSMVSVPGKDHSRSLTQVFMELVTKNNHLLDGEGGDKISVSRQVPKYLVAKKKELESIAYEIRKIGKTGKEKKSKFQTKVNFNTKCNDMVLKIKKREEKKWEIVEKEGNNELGKELSERIKKITTTHLLDEKETLKRIMKYEYDYVTFL